MLAQAAAAPALAQGATGGAGDAGAPGGDGAAAGPGEGGRIEGAAGFTDLQDHWARDFVDAMRQARILAVPKDGKFRPDEPVTRLDFAVWVARAMELTPEAPATSGAPGSPEEPEPLFTDWKLIPEEAQPWVGAAVKAKLINGYPDPARKGPDGQPLRSFQPGNPITRAELGTVFGRALVQLGVELETRYLYLFEDRTAIPSWAQEAAASVQAEVIMGRPGWKLATFAPAARTTRAEATVMINRFVNARARLLPHAPPPKPAAAKMIVAAYYYRGSESSYQALLAHGRGLTHLFYFGFALDAGGNLSGFPLQRDLEAARRHELPVLAVVTNGFSRSLSGALLADGKARQRAVDNIVKLMDQGYVGVNLDFEEVDPADRDRYTEFVGEVAGALKAKGYLATVALPARNARMATQAWARAYDYDRIGRYVDYIVVMTYDQSYAGSGPGPIGGLDWAEGMVAYATSVVSPQKLLLGIPAYGRDWPDPDAANGNGTGNGARAVKARPVHEWVRDDEFYSIEELVAKFGGAPVFDPATGESVYRYVDEAGVSRVVWFTDPQGLRLKLALVAKHNLGGVGMWRLGQEPPAFWDAYGALAGSATAAGRVASN